MDLVSLKRSSGRLTCVLFRELRRDAGDATVVFVERELEGPKHLVALERRDLDEHAHHVRNDQRMELGQPLAKARMKRFDIQTCWELVHPRAAH